MEPSRPSAPATPTPAGPGPGARGRAGAGEWGPVRRPADGMSRIFAMITSGSVPVSAAKIRDTCLVGVQHLRLQRYGDDGGGLVRPPRRSAPRHGRGRGRPGPRASPSSGSRPASPGPGHQRDLLSADVADGLAPGRSVSLAGGYSPSRSVTPGGPPARDDGHLRRARGQRSWPGRWRRDRPAAGRRGPRVPLALGAALELGGQRQGWLADGTVSSTETGAPAASARSAALIASQFRLTSSGPETVTSANTGGGAGSARPRCPRPRSRWCSRSRRPPPPRSRRGTRPGAARRRARPAAPPGHRSPARPVPRSTPRAGAARATRASAGRPTGTPPGACP